MYAIHLVDNDADNSSIFVTDFVDDPPTTASYLELSISTAIAVQLLRSCTLDSAPGQIGCDCQTWTLRGMDTVSCDNCHHLILHLHTGWTYWVLGTFCHRLSLYTWVS